MYYSRIQLHAEYNHLFEDFDQLVIKLDEPHKVLIDWFDFTNNIVWGNSMKSFSLLKDYFKTWCRLHIYYPNHLKQLCAEWCFEAYAFVKHKANEEWVRSKVLDDGKLYDQYKAEFLSFASQFICNETAYFDEHLEFTEPLNDDYFKTHTTFANPFACYTNRYLKEKNALLKNDNELKVLEVLENWQQYDLGKPTNDNIAKATGLSVITIKRHTKNSNVKEAKKRASEVYKLVNNKVTEKPSDESMNAEEKPLMPWEQTATTFMESEEELSYFEAEHLGFNDFDEHY